jgi:proline iminopeptidase
VGSEKDAVPLIVIHGGPAAPHYYLETLQGLADNRPVILYDQRGCGNSDPLEDSTYWTIEFFLEELNQLILQLGLDRVHILGQSWGTILAAEYAFTHPEGLESLIFASPALSTPLWVQDAKELLTTLPEDLQQIIYEAEQSGNYESPEYQEAMMEYYKLYVCRMDPWPEILNLTLEYLNTDIYHYMWGASEFNANGTLQYYDCTPLLYMINVPTLFTCGKYDEATPETTAYYQSLIPGAKIKVFNRSAHMCHITEAPKYIKAVRNFLKKVEKKKVKSR